MDYACVLECVYLVIRKAFRYHVHIYKHYMPIIQLHIPSFIILCRDDSVLVCIPMHHAVVSLALQWKQQIFACGSHQNENKQDDKASLF